MMIERLSSDEQDALYTLPLYIAVLIASADGEIEESEIKRTMSVISKQTRSESSHALSDFYEKASVDMEDKLKFIIYHSPRSKQELATYLSQRIANATSVLQKLDKRFRKELHTSFGHLAEQIARASGGIMGFGSIGTEESRFINVNLKELLSGQIRLENRI